MPRFAFALLCSFLAACGPGSALYGTGEDRAAELGRTLTTVPAQGSADRLDVGQWNLEWFGSPGLAPFDDALQQANARDVISGSAVELWALIEVVDGARFEALKAQLPGFDGLVANDPRVAGGAASYTTGEQKPAVLFRADLFRLKSARVVLAQYDADFAGRPPLEVTLEAKLGAETTQLTLLLLHMKAGSDGTSYQKRLNAAAALKAYLDAEHPADKVLVLGDWNDDVDTSIRAGLASPYAALGADGARYTFLTAGLSAAGEHSTLGYPDMIDHQLATDELAALCAPEATRVFHVESLVAAYRDTTSDHLPVLTAFRSGPPQPPKPSLQLLSPNGGEQLAAGATVRVRWKATAVQSARLELTTDGVAWSAVAGHLTGDGFDWTAPAVASAAAKLRVVDEAGAAMDESDAPFRLLGPASLTLLAPNGGDVWAAKTQRTLRWAAQAVETVKLELSLDDGASWSVIGTAWGPAGALGWTVPNLSAQKARVRVSDAAVPARADVSDAAFQISGLVKLTPAVFINELLSNEPGTDARGEFVELLNRGAPVDLSGWTLSDSLVRHVFPAGTVLGTNQALVVYGGAEAIPPGVSAVAASTGLLRLGNNGGTLNLRDAAGALVDRCAYGIANDGVSFNRSPDGRSGAALVAHDTLSGLAASPGKAVAGSAFGAGPYPEHATAEAEPNDMLPLADYWLGAGKRFTGALDAADTDWVKLKVSNAGVVTLGLELPAWSSQISWSLVSVAVPGTELDWGLGFGFSRTLPPGEYALKLTLPEGASPESYGLTLSAAAGVLGP